MNRRILVSVMVIGLVGALAGSSTMALFNDSETSSDNQFTAGELDLKIDWDESYNGEHVETQELTNNPGTIFDFEDIKPGDHGEATVSLHLEDNPGWIWMNMNQTSNWDNACTEPERAAEGQCGSEGELDEELEFTIWADDGDNILQDDENVIFEGTAEELEETSDEGVLLDGNPSTNETEAFPGQETGYIGVKWSLPLETGNQVQGDSVSYDVNFYTEQRRHNDNPDNPWDEVEEPENEPPVASFERANEEPFSTTVDEEVRLFSTSTDDDEIVRNVWNLGDGTTKYGQDVWHNWSEAGNYTVELTVTDSDGETDTATKVMEVMENGSEQPPTCEEPEDSSKEYTADEIGQAKYGYNFEDLSGETACEVEELFNNQPFAEGLGPGDVMTREEISQDKFSTPYDELSEDSAGEVDQAYRDQFVDETSFEGNLSFDDQMVSEDGEVSVDEINTGQDSTVFVTYESENGTVNAGYQEVSEVENSSIDIEIEEEGVPGTYTAHIVPEERVSGYEGTGGLLSQSTIDSVIYSDNAEITEQEETPVSGELTFNDQSVENGQVTLNNVSTTVGTTIYVTYEDGNDTVIAGIGNGPAGLDSFDPLTIDVDASGVPGEHTARMIEKPVSIGYSTGDVLQESTLEKQYFSQSAQISAEEDPAEYTASQDGEITVIEPLSGDIPVEELYDFRLPDRYDNEATRNATNGATFPGNGPYYGSVGTEDIQQGDTSIMFLYEGPDGLSFVVVHEGEGSDDGGSATFEITDLNSDGEWVVKDDLYLDSDGTLASSNYDRWNTSSNPQTIDWTWGGGGSDGGAFQTLPNDFEFTIDPAFNENSELYEQFYNGDVDEWQVLSGDLDNPNRTNLDLDEEVTVSGQ